ncbi:MAG: ArnT family glycosyltransferase [Bryobacteraceae bacterium]
MNEPAGRKNIQRDMRRISVGSWILIAATVFYLSLSVAVAFTKAPWADEGWIAAPAYNLMTNGSMGTPSLEPTGSNLNANLKGINEYTYTIMPLHVLMQAAWFKVFGFGLLSMRAISTAWGLVVLVSLFVIVEKLTRNRVLASLALLMTAIDFTFIDGAADGRMDMMCAGLNFGALACYLAWREEHFERAILAGHCLIAAALFTHPNGLLGGAGLVFLTIWLDRGRLRPRHLYALLPYVAGALGWGAYILQRPDYFWAQFRANAGVGSGARFAGVLDPHGAVLKELFVRYVAHYGWKYFWMPYIGKATILVPAFYWLALFTLIAGIRAKQAPGGREIPLLAALYLICMTFLVGFKAPIYLVHIIPLYAAVFVLWLERFPRTRGSIACGAAIVITLVSLHVKTLVGQIRADDYGKGYVPTVAYLKQHAGEDAAIMGDSTLGFALPYRRIVDDARLGYYSGKRTPYIVVDFWYQHWWEGFGADQAAVAAHIRRVLTEEHDLVFQAGSYRIYKRKPGRTTT